MLPLVFRGARYRCQSASFDCRHNHVANSALKPENVWPHLYYPANCRCPTCDHLWRASVGSRSAGNACSGRAPRAEPSFAALNPELRHEWAKAQNTLDTDTLLPPEFTCGVPVDTPGRPLSARVEMALPTPRVIWRRTASPRNARRSQINGAT